MEPNQLLSISTYQGKIKLKFSRIFWLPIYKEGKKTFIVDDEKIKALYRAIKRKPGVASADQLIALHALAYGG